MEEMKFGYVFLFSSAIFFLSFPSLASSLDYQTLLVTPLSERLTTHRPQFDSESESQLNLEPAALPSSLSVQLHHIDALSSSDASPEQLFNLRLRRDALRVENIASRATGNATRAAGRGFSGSVVSGLSQGSGEYFTRLGVGTPPKNVYMVLDTGSDVVWLQCSPCKSCYEQSDPVFDPTKSKSFSTVPCNSPICRRLDSSGCNSRQGTCLYQVSYGDGSFTVGDFSTETLSFRGARMGRVALGCGHDNEGLFVGAAGLLGLGRGGMSFPSQTKNRFNGKFSYCLVDRSAAGKPSSIIFGNDAVPRTAVFTPMIKNPKLDTFYYIELLGISVGGTRVAGVTESLFTLDSAGNGGVIVDSGTSVTRLTRSAYLAFRDAFRAAGAKSLKRAPDFSLFDTCFDVSGKTTVKVPTVVMHFRGGDVSLPASNYLIPVNRDGRFCFAFAGTNGGLSIIGNIQQQGFRVVYDLAGSRVGFSPRGC